MNARKKQEKRPDLPEISVQFELNDQIEERFGPDLNEAAREAIRRFGEVQGITSKNELAKRVGIRAPSLAMLLAGEQGMRVDVLSRVCAALDMSPAEFFALGGAYESDETASEVETTIAMFRRTVPESSRVKLLELALLVGSTKLADDALDAALVFVRVVAEKNGVDAGAVKRTAKKKAKHI